jgi:NADH-quinone oxidoreductase subunit H
MVQELAQLIADKAGLDFSLYGIWIVIVIKLAIVAMVFLPLISLVAMYSIWWERKVAGHIQGRLGPMHVGGWHGWSQSLADGAKLLLKEDLLPDGADAFLFHLAPYLAFAPVFAAFLALPFGPQFIFEGGLNIGVLYLLAVLGVEVMGVILAGWASNSKWSVYGAMREACQMVSYEIPLGLSIICGVIVAGTLNLTELGYLQARGPQDWFIFHNPFAFMAFLLYFVASLASNKRAPFDLPESESELVAGFHTEYSGLRWSFFFFAEYGSMFVVGGIQAALFLGGWNSPFGRLDPVYRFLGYDPVVAGMAYFNGAISAAHGTAGIARAMGVSPIGLIAINLWGGFWFILKAMIIIFVQMWIRWTLPRIRIDQVLYACVKVLLPMSLITFVGVAAWVWLVPQPASVVLDNGQVVARLGHLASAVPPLQLVTQIILTLIGAAVILFCVGIVLAAYLRPGTHPPQSFFADVMPVGNQISFTTGKPEEPPPEAKTT